MDDFTTVRSIAKSLHGGEGLRDTKCPMFDVQDSVGCTLLMHNPHTRQTSSLGIPYQHETRNIRQSVTRAFPVWTNSHPHKYTTWKTNANPVTLEQCAGYLVRKAAGVLSQCCTECLSQNKAAISIPV